MAGALGFLTAQARLQIPVGCSSGLASGVYTIGLMIRLVARAASQPSRTIRLGRELVRLFRNRRLSFNPNGQTGINVISDIGQGGQLSGANLISIPNGTIQGDIFGADFANYKAANFVPSRLGYFHYAIHAHRYSANPGSSGYAEIVGDDFLVTLQCSAFNSNVLSTTMHELGHNIGLLHGGNTDCNRKPNYNSIMNYNFQFSGQDINCDWLGDGVPNIWVRMNISSTPESSLTESEGSAAPRYRLARNRRVENGIQVPPSIGF